MNIHSDREYNIKKATAKKGKFTAFRALCDDDLSGEGEAAADDDAGGEADNGPLAAG